MNYEELYNVYNRSQAICNPIDFMQRQFALSLAIAEYLIERDKPIQLDEENEKSD